MSEGYQEHCNPSFARLYLSIPGSICRSIAQVEGVHIIGKAVWDEGGDIRGVIWEVSTKEYHPEEVERKLSTAIKY